MRRAVVFFTALVVAAAGTALLGWWAPALVAAAAVLADRGRHAAARAGLAAALAWALLLWRDASAGPVGALAELLGQVLPLGGAAGFVALTLGFAFLLGWAAGRTVLGMLPRLAAEERPDA